MSTRKDPRNLVFREAHVPAKPPHGRRCRLRVSKRPAVDRKDGKGDWCIEVAVQEDRKWRVVARTDISQSEQEASLKLLHGVAGRTPKRSDGC